MESMYPDAAARRAADEVVDGLSIESTMLEYLVAWEEAYLKAGGRVNL